MSAYQAVDATTLAMLLIRQAEAFGEEARRLEEQKAVFGWAGGLLQNGMASPADIIFQLEASVSRAHGNPTDRSNASAREQAVREVIGMIRALSVEAMYERPPKPEMPKGGPRDPFTGRVV